MRLLDHHIFGHTHHWSLRQSIVVRLHAEPLRGSGQFPLDALIKLTKRTVTRISNMFTLDVSEIKFLIF